MGERTVKTHGRKPMMRIGSSKGVKGSPVAFTSFLNPYRPRMPTEDDAGIPHTSATR